MYTAHEFILKINSKHRRHLCFNQDDFRKALAQMSSISALAQKPCKPLRAGQHPKGVLREPATEARSAEGSSNHSQTLSKGELKLNNAFSKEITSRGDRGTALLF